MTPSHYRFILYPVITALVLFAILAGCQQFLATPEKEAAVTPLPEAPPTATTCSRGSLADAPEVVIGVIYPLSQRNTMLTGFAMQAATNLAVSAINDGGGIQGKPVRTIVYDSASSPTQGALFAERLITLDCVAAMVGVFHSDIALAVKEVAVRHHIPMIFADPYADEITDDLAPEIFRIAPTRTMLIKMMGEWLAQVGDYNHDDELLVVLLVENSAYGNIRSQLAQEWLPTYGIKPEIITVDLPTTDFSSMIARIVALDKLPDAIFTYIHNGDSLLLQQQLMAAGIGPKSGTLLITTASALNDTKFWQQVPNGTYTIITQVGPWPSTVPETGQRFAALYQQYFDRWPEATAFEAYDVLLLMADAIGRARSLQADDIIRALETTDIELASGHYTFPYGSTNPPDGDTVPYYMWHQWPNSHLLYLQYTEAGQKALDAAVIWPPLYQTVSGPLAPGLRARQSQ